MNFPALFSPGKIGRMETKNRLVMAPMVRNYGDAEGKVTRKYIANIERTARGGVGTMILDAMHVRLDGRGFANQAGIHDDYVIPGLSELVEAAHKHNARIGAQLYHAGRQTSSQVTGIQPVAPSPIADPLMNELPREISTDEVKEFVNDFAEAARRAKSAGFDFVEIHGAHGYLITQFLSPFTNHRTDEYGGSDEARMKFLEEIYLAVREAVGEDFPIITRLSGEEMVPSGLTIEDTIRICKRLEELGVNAVHISAGNYASFEKGYLIQPMAIPDAPIVHLASEVKEHVNIPVIAVGKIRTPELAEDILQKGKADFIALGRVLLADHDWPKKAQEGRVEEINKCIACNQGCITRLFQGEDVWCTVNPETAREDEFALAMPEKKMNVLVAGGGPAGMESAKFAAERGHKVTLMEKKGVLGGQLISASAAPYRPGWEELREFQVKEVKRLGVDIRMNTEVTPELVRQENPDAVIVAIGASQVPAKIPGIEHDHVVTAIDVLEGNAQAKGNVIVMGGGCSGAQTAEFLADKGLKVTIVEMLGEIAKDAAVVDRELLIKRLHNLGVDIRTETKIMAIEKDKVLVENPDGDMELPADTVVFCLGSKSNDGLTGDLRESVENVIVVGDAYEPRKVTEALVEAARAVLSLQEKSIEVKAA